MPALNQAERMSDAARTMQDQPDPVATMQTAVDLAVQLVSSCDAAALTMVRRRGRLSTLAYTDNLALFGDAMQYELSEGPCIEAVWSEPLVHTPDLLEERRWPTWAAQVSRDLGARAMMCFRLYTHADTLGALNLYSRRRWSFDGDDRDEGVALAAHVAVAVSAALARDDLEIAVDARTAIGQATGILMERHQLSPDRAFAVLARISSERNLRLRAVAEHLVSTRHLPASHE